MTRARLHRWAAAALAWQLTSIPTAMAAPPPPAPGSEAAAEVEELNSAALEAFKNKEYDEAARLFEAAYEKNPEPNYLFNIGRVYEEKGEFENAIEWYDRFIHLPEVELQAREIALERLRVLRAIVAESKAEAEPEATPKEVADEPEEDERKPTPPLRIAGYVLLGIGGAALVAGAGFGGAAVQRNNDLDSFNTLEARNEAIDKGKRNALIADSLFIAGGVVALTGLVLVLVSLKDRKGKSQRASIAPTFARGGGGVAARVRF